MRLCVYYPLGLIRGVVPCRMAVTESHAETAPASVKVDGRAARFGDGAEDGNAIWKLNKS